MPHVHTQAVAAVVALAAGRCCLDCEAPTIGRTLRCLSCKRVAARTSQKAYLATAKGRAYKRRKHREWMAAHREQQNAYNNAYRLRHPARVKASTAKWRAKQAKSPRRVPLAYPFIAAPRPEHAELRAVCELIPRAMPDRDDIAQSIMLAILEGRATLAGLRSDRKSLSAFYTRHRKASYEQNGFAVSLSQPRLDGRSWDDVISRGAWG